MKKSITLLLMIFMIYGAQAQVVINEYSAANLEGFLDNFGKGEDWIELYNSSDIDVDISGYHLSDKENKPAKWEIPAGTIIPANGHLVFWCSGRDESCPGIYHTNFKLTQTKGNETLILSDPSENVINSIPLGITQIESSWCRATDGSDDWKICTNPTLASTNNGSAQFSAYTATPSMDIAAGFYEGEVTVSLTNNEANSTMRFTTDGRNVTASSPVYQDPITITSTTVIKARAFSEDSDILPGKMDFNTYFIDEEYSLAVFSVAADDVQELANGNGSIIPIGSIEYFTKDKEREATSFGSLNRHGQDSWVLNHRSIDWVSRDEMGYSKAVEAQLFSRSERDEYQKFMFRNSGDDNYPAQAGANHEGSAHIRDEYVQTVAQEGGLKLDVRSAERVILFLNGDYWGVYGMRDRPVDHDYTDYYYDQGKYDLQYLTTWGDTELQYGGQQALNDWYRLRNFIMDNDMGDAANYEKVKDELNVLSLMDYMIVNLNAVASDWLNYNTGWWRGTNPDGDHKKWGYILWDLDATYDYYINYSGVPNISPTAAPCDIEAIGDYMDQFFFGDGEVGPGGVSCAVQLDPTTCESITNGSSPYAEDDMKFQLVINQDNACCNNWDDICQNQYDDIEGGGTLENCPSIIDGSCPYPPTDPIAIQVVDIFPFCCNNWGGFCENQYENFSNGGGFVDEGVNGNVGQHAKIFLKLQEESPEFRQLYYGRQADLQNTTYSCENMLTTLDRMLGDIEPEMPRQIARWGGTLNKWNQNVERLKSFIEQRCELFDEGMVSCFDLEGPYALTLMTEPDGVGEIDLNTLDIEQFPWTGNYYGNMENTIKAKALEDGYEFSHWLTSNGSVIFPDSLERKATISLTGVDTLTAVFTSIVNIDEIAAGIKMQVFPNPSTGVVNIRYELEEQSEIRVSLTNMMGTRIANFQEFAGAKSAGIHNHRLDISQSNVPTGIYLVQLHVNNQVISKKISIIR